MTTPPSPKPKSAEEWVSKEFPFGSKYGIFDIDTVKEIQLDAAKAALTRVCRIIQKRTDDYDAEHGHTDIETGQREYPKNGDEYMFELTEIIESIALARDNLKDIDDL